MMPSDPAPTPIEPRAERRYPSFRTTLVRVMIVQVVALVLLWILQARYNV